MAKKIDINTITITKENICVPSDILKECESIYSNFKKMYAKYAPGKLAFFKFNSTIVDNLNNLTNKGCSDIYKISVYQSYFKNCNNIENIVKTTGKILSKLDSLLEAIGTSKKASLSTLGVKGLFTKKRKNDDKLNEYYNYFNNLAANMRTTIKNDRVVKALGKCMEKFKFLSYNDTDNHQPIQDSDKQAMDTASLLNNIKTDNLNMIYLECENVTNIPSYAEVMCNFLNNAIIEYNNLYEIQHKLKEETGDVKSPIKNVDSDEIKKIKSKYRTYTNQLKVYKKDLEDSIKYLKDNSKKFQKNYWYKDTKKTTIDITNIEKDMRELCNKIKTNDKDIRGKLKKNNDKDSKKYSSMLTSLSSSMKIAADNISRLAYWVTNQGEYTTISNKSSPEFVMANDFNTIKNNINDYIKTNTSNDTINNEQVNNIFNDYLKFFEEIKQEYLKILDSVSLSTNDVKKLNYDINRKEKQAHLDRIKNKVSVVASATGVGISILSALMRLIG